jgi:type IV secretory pathway VirJ component
MKLFKGNSFLLAAFLFIIMQPAFSQTPSPAQQLPFSIAPSGTDTAKPMIVYITGDGGLNKFSKTLCGQLALQGYPVVALDARAYFWKKKTPAQTAMDITRLIRVYQQTWHRSRIVLLGYSFGADVMPFVYNNLPPDIAVRVLNLCLLSPSGSTDFEIHISVMLGAGFARGENAVAELNKISTKPLALLFGSDENDFPLSHLKIKNYTVTRLPGGHHYEGDEIRLCNAIVHHIAVIK